MALVVALALPPVLLVALGAIQLQAVVTERQRLQDASDAAALAGAQQLTLSQDGVTDRTIAFARAQLGPVPAGGSLNIAVTLPTPDAIKVAMDMNLPSFFVNLFPPGGFDLHVEAVAQNVARSPLCVLVFGSKGGDKLDLKDASRMQAGSCLVHSNQDITVDPQGSLQAAAAETGGKGKGPISPAPHTGAPDISDPFTSIPLDFPVNSCGGGVPSGRGSKATGPSAQPSTNAPVVYSGGTATLGAGVHCGDITVQDGAALTLASGEHYFGGHFTVAGTSKVSGTDTILIFSDASKFDFKDSASVDLRGRNSGPLAGFVIASARDNKGAFTIESDHVSQLYGTVYIPSGKLEVTGQTPVNQAAPWTVVVAQAINLKRGGAGSPSLSINSNYGAGTVPVPSGVGPSVGSSRLVQ